MTEERRFVGKGIVKKDAEALLSGRPVYTDDLAPDNCLIVKLLRSPHAHAHRGDPDRYGQKGAGNRSDIYL